jgi:uncharacterized membrane protein YedE/YeeE
MGTKTGPSVPNPLMAKPRAFRMGWVHVTLTGLVLLAAICIWSYFGRWQIVRNLPKQPVDSYPAIAVDYYPPFAERLATVFGLVLFLGGLTFGFVRSAYRLARRLLSPGSRVS